jgi:hypothetical protein
MARSAADWITVAAPQLRIVSEAQWSAAHHPLTESRAAYLRATDGKVCVASPSAVPSRSICSPGSRCAICNGSIYVKSRDHGKRRAFFYGCTTYHLRGRRMCRHDLQPGVSNPLEIPMDALNEALLEAIEHEVLHPNIVELAIERAAKRLRPSQAEVGAERAHLEDQLGAIGASWND